MSTYRKRPVEIEARQWDGDAQSATPIIGWILAGGHTARYHDEADEHGQHIAIDTLEGTHRTSPGDYVIRGVQGEFYPCKPDIFEATYDLVETPDAA